MTRLYKNAEELLEVLEMVKAGEETFSMPSAIYTIVKEICRLKQQHKNAHPLSALTEEWGGSMCGIINGNITNIADHLNKQQRAFNEENRKKLECQKQKEIISD